MLRPLGDSRGPAGTAAGPHLPRHPLFSPHLRVNFPVERGSLDQTSGSGCPEKPQAV